jgi:glycerophosphoryl diester phosphodiesterase
MKKIFFACLLFAGCNTARHITKNKMNTTYNPVVAHRGAWKKNHLPENSIASLQQAVQSGCAGSEFDVWMTADDSLVIHHDPDFNHLRIEQVSFAALKTLPLSNGEPLPTLHQYLQAGLSGNPATRLVLEIKPSLVSKERGQEVARKVMDMVTAFHAEKRIIYISFDYDILKKIITLDPTAHTQYLNGDKSPDQLKTDGITGADYHLSVFRQKPEWIAMAKKYGIILNAWTVNNADDMRWLLDNNFDFITTNEPELLFEILKQRKEIK